MENKLAKRKPLENISFLSLLFVFSCMYGFVYEIIFYYFEGGMKNIYWRGGCFGPWITIYGIGGVVAYLILKRFKKHPSIVFFGSLSLLSAFELVAGALLYYFCNGHRGWDYNIERWNFGNIGGFICLRSAIVWGISGLILVYAFAPLVALIQKKLTKKVFMILAFSCIGIVIFDNIYNHILVSLIPNLTSAIDFYKQFGISVLTY